MRATCPAHRSMRRVTISAAEGQVFPTSVVVVVASGLCSEVLQVVVVLVLHGSQGHSHHGPAGAQLVQHSEAVPMPLACRYVRRRDAVVVWRTQACTLSHLVQML